MSSGTAAIISNPSLLAPAHAPVKPMPLKRNSAILWNENYDDIKPIGTSWTYSEFSKSEVSLPTSVAIHDPSKPTSFLPLSSSKSCFGLATSWAAHLLIPKRLLARPRSRRVYKEGPEIGLQVFLDTKTESSYPNAEEGGKAGGSVSSEGSKASVTSCSRVNAWPSPQPPAVDASVEAQV